MARTPPPAYVIESGDIARDGKGVFELAREEIRGFTHLHYSKYYETNPVGGPIFVVARDASSGTIVGTAALHPAEFVVGGNAHLGCVAGDFAVASRQRVCIDSPVRLSPLTACWRANRFRRREAGLLQVDDARYE